VTSIFGGEIVGALGRWLGPIIGVGGPTAPRVIPALNRVRELTQAELEQVTGAAGKFPTGSTAAAIIRQARATSGWYEYIKTAQLERFEGQALSAGVRDHSHFSPEELLELAKEFIASGGH